jgi:hypothetical protein
MLEWLRRTFWQSNERRRFLKTIDALNVEDGGGEPVVSQELLGSLKLRSGTLVLGDPQYLSSVEVSAIAVDEIAISATLWRYPSGLETVAALTIGLGNSANVDSHRKIGKLGIDSAKLVVADKEDIEEHWTDVGKDRIGVISTARDDVLLRMLKKRYKLDAVQVSPIRAEFAAPVSESLEKDIEEYLKSIPAYADYPFQYFHVQTNNSFDRVNYADEAWSFIPVGNEPAPFMFACDTGRGDGLYNVKCGFSGDVPRVLSIRFIEESDERN